MEKDFSRLLYDKYFGLTDPNIEVKLVNGTVFPCIIIGFYKSVEGELPYIEKWHIANKKNEHTLGINAYDLPIGKIIRQKDIAEVRFFEDGSVLRFE
jgi:hypothetical protein